jgi:mannose-1-phosphate guanylyltransferase
VEYGWIEPADLILGRWPWPIYRVRRFWEKPSKPIAERLEAAGCLWNCFVVVARPSTLEQLIRRATSELYDAFAPLRARLGTPWEKDTARAVYWRLPSTDLSRHVFQTCAESLAVLPVTGVSWTDLGDPTRAREAQTRRDWQPAIAR